MSGLDNKLKWAASATELKTTIVFLGHTIVIAPHPDDESLGCGGTIALLKKAGKSVKIIFVSDGSLSHPNSIKYPAPLLIQLREKEALEAARILGVAPKDCYFMRLKDGAVPNVANEGFEVAAGSLLKILKPLQVQAILLPWKNDPHPDHQACWEIVNQVMVQMESRIILYHYLIWFWERGVDDIEILNGVDWFKVDISSVMDLKMKAINAHQSQVTTMIDDDQDGFILSCDVLNHFNDHFELFAMLKNN